jgi:hypothetical protein
MNILGCWDTAAGAFAAPGDESIDGAWNSKPSENSVNSNVTPAVRVLGRPRGRGALAITGGGMLAVVKLVVIGGCGTGTNCVAGMPVCVCVSIQKHKRAKHSRRISSLGLRSAS